ncbi:NAD(+) diphosphatase [Pedococcus bigeumensis]|uniref:NAD(+) diphosphatase n=1 Tax=Pedococcus bigeumensis TaxID=433644 RepID=A0A502CTB5_9MICO|nr:NAD(+) diphosphatase [Pedococcus bigeumensis]TPG15972.1 NAD(+) diphosphatase [Pedococcus bigeumensis]
MGLLTETLPNLSLARPGLDRHAERRGEPDLVARLLADADTRVLVVRGDKVAVAIPGEGGSHDPALALRPPEESDSAALVLFLGQDGDGTAYLAVAEPAAPDGDADGGPTDGVDQWRSLRQIGADLSDRDATIFATALALSNWHATHTHCPRCGAATEPVQGGWLRRCPQDASEHYPRTDVAVIMSVIDDEDRILLARGAGWGTGRFSVLAGFLEPGESLAAAVAREVHEEVGLVVRDVEYLGDQPWPFPNSIMVGFTTRASSSELRLQESEIAEARWFTRDEYREILAAGQVSASTRLSIARRIIERWLGHDLDEVTPA